MITENVWVSGLSLPEYVEKMDHFQKEMKQRLEEIRITSSEFNKLREITKKRRMLIFTESWCGDSLMNLPILAKIAEASPMVSIKYYYKSKFPELARFFEEKDLGSIPLCWVTDEKLNLIGYWIERPKSADRLILDWKQGNPEFLKIIKNSALSEEEKRVEMKPIYEKLLDEMWNWYDTNLQSETIKEVTQILLKD